MTDAHDLSRRTVLKTIGAGVTAGTVLTGSGAAQVPGNHGLEKELAEVRSATAAYNDTGHAETAAYVAEEAPPICGMGHHWINMGNVGEPDRTKPAVLVYGERNGNLVLGAVEYFFPKGTDFFLAPPDLFDNADPTWQILCVEDAPLPFDEAWTLHAWVHNHNPKGVFHPTNPRKLFNPDGCVHGHSGPCPDDGEGEERGGRGA